MDLTTDDAHTRELTRVDWVVSSTWNRLHYVELTDEQCVELEDGRYLEGPDPASVRPDREDDQYPRFVHPHGS